MKHKPAASAVPHSLFIALCSLFLACTRPAGHNYLRGSLPGAWATVLGQKVNLQAGTDYELGIRYKKANTGSARIRIDVSGLHPEWDDWYAPPLCWENLSEADAGYWNEKTANFSIVAAQDYYIIVIPDSPSPGIVGIDEIWLYDRADTSKTNLLANGDFADTANIRDINEGRPSDISVAGYWYKHSSWTSTEKHGDLHPIAALPSADQPTANLPQANLPQAGGALTLNNALAGKGFAEKGAKITVKATAALGSRFARFEIDGAGLKPGSGSTRTFTMPAGPVTVTAIFEEDTSMYDIVLTQAAGGAFTVKAGDDAPSNEKTGAKAGTKITLEAAPSGPDYKFSRFVLSGAKLDSGFGAVRTFTMPAGPVSVSAVYRLSDPVAGGRSNFHIYIAFGQSNMEGANGQRADAKANHALPSEYENRFLTLEAASDGGFADGWGRAVDQWATAKPPLASGGLTPVDYFGRYLVENTDADTKIGVVVIAVGGATLDFWDPDAGDNEDVKSQINPDGIWNVDNWGLHRIARYTTDGDIYRRMVELGQLAQEQGVIKGILVLQGEGGGGDKYGGWDKLLKKIYDRVLADLDLEPGSIPLLAGEPSQDAGNAAGYGVLGINKDYPRFYGIETQDFAALPKKGWGPYTENKGTTDGVHFTNAAQVIIGRRFGEKMFELVY
jgi:hypothetical protein